jgi:hypothetical protein
MKRSRPPFESTPTFHRLKTSKGHLKRATIDRSLFQLQAARRKLNQREISMPLLMNHATRT